ncbi:cholesterol esterase [Streptomyces fuscichromogenes]|uniref:Cholesterol esterase n=1 Tax=Streptomyces fuscichromogenes TaxID=1324013 RepID=A0A918CRV5_9ACTN|nr:cholesterol esterase [Streptomyces fuscichromogenes]
MILVPGVAACAAVGVAMAQGVLAASFFISGQKFQVAADSLTARGFSLYGMIDVTRKHELVPVAVSGFRHATVSGLCQSVVVDVPVLGTQTLRLTGGDGRPVEASNLFIDATTESVGQANFDGLDIGVAQGALTKGPVRSADRNSRFFDPDGVAQQALSTTLTDVRVSAVAVSAGTFNIPGLRVRLQQGDHACF